MPRKYKRKTYTKPMKYQVADKAEAAYNMAVALKRIVNVEKKYYDTTISTAAVTETGVITDISAIAQGDSALNRDGDSLKPLGLNMRFTLKGDASTSRDTSIRVIVFRMKHENAVVPSVSDVLDVVSINAMYNYTERPRFNVLMDKIYTLPINDSTVIPQRYYSFSSRLTGHMKFVTGQVTHEDGGIYLLRISDESTATNRPQFGSTTRITYVDN